MIFSLNKKEEKELNKLFDTYIHNNEVATYLNECVLNKIVTDEDKKEYRIKPLEINDYLSDAYYQNVQLKEIKEKNYAIKYETYLPQVAFIYDDIKVDEDDYFLIKNQIGYFNQPFNYPTIQKDDVIWMGVFPHEINTMKQCKLNDASHVIIFGLGLAYFPYQYCARADKITIIDNDKMMIKIFKEHILPHFKNKDKYEIVLADAFNYIDKIKKSDAVFVDLYHDVNDGFFIYLKMKQALKEIKNVTYWIEESMVASFRNVLINLINEEYHHVKIDYHRSENKVDELTNRLHFYLEKRKFTTYAQIKKMLSKESLLDLMLKV